MTCDGIERMLREAVLSIREESPGNIPLDYKREVPLDDKLKEDESKEKKPKSSRLIKHHLAGPIAAGILAGYLTIFGIPNTKPQEPVPIEYSNPTALAFGPSMAYAQDAEAAVDPIMSYFDEIVPYSGIEVVKCNMNDEAFARAYREIQVYLYQPKPLTYYHMLN